ncbi:MAG TPA: LLM class F420-dependent oxidoreductase [Acidimicrobiia bacterium]|jgi:F420-dependent oxidoreductase-like protein|nr:LLM class F420-dependent oxidoreductase [Acidimicrobiia bacterium]
MRVSFKTVPQDSDWGSMRDMWLAADDIDVYDAGWNFDHFYPILQDDRTGPCFEGWTMLAALATITRRIRLGVMVTGNPYRHPALLANIAASVDVISDGRLELGIGAGWNEEESTAYGIDLPPLRERFDRLEEACEVIDLLLTKETASFRGRYYQLTDARCEPKPVQKPRPPILIGGGGEKRTLRIAARWADQWNAPGASPEVLAHKIEVLHRHCADVGRDPAQIEVSVQVRSGADAAQVAADASALVDAGAQHIIVGFRAPFDPARLEPIARALQDALPLSR